jgi:hypothetical protein
MRGLRQGSRPSPAPMRRCLSRFIAVREIVVKPFHRATEMLRARRANLAEGARLLLARETGDRRSIPWDPLDRCEGSAGRTQ